MGKKRKKRLVKKSQLKPLEIWRDGRLKERYKKLWRSCWTNGKINPFTPDQMFKKYGVSVLVDPSVTENELNSKKLEDWGVKAAISDLFQKSDAVEDSLKKYIKDQKDSGIEHFVIRTVNGGLELISRGPSYEHAGIKNENEEKVFIENELTRTRKYKIGLTLDLRDDEKKLGLQIKDFKRLVLNLKAQIKPKRSKRVPKTEEQKKEQELRQLIDDHKAEQREEKNSVIAKKYRSYHHPIDSRD